MGKSNKNKNRKRQTESGASDVEGEMPTPTVRTLPVMQERKGSKFVTMAQSAGVEMPEMLTGSKETAAGFVPVIKSFFKPLITVRGKRPKFIAPTSGVPSGIKKAWGYWRPQHKTATKSGAPITLWYYYEIGDGPFADSTFGEAIGDAFWVKRDNVAMPSKSAYDNAYNPGVERRTMSSRVRIENNQSNTGYSSAGESSAWDTDAGSVNTTRSVASVSSDRKKKLKKTKSQRDSENTRTSDDEPVVKPSVQPTRNVEQQRERNLTKMRSLPVFLRSLTADSLPAAVFGESLPAGRLDAYLECKQWFPSRHYMMHYADIRAKFDPSADNIKVLFGLCIDLDPDFPQCQDMVKWLVKNRFIADEAEPDVPDAFEENLQAGCYKTSSWHVLATGDRSSREIELEKQIDVLQAELASVRLSVSDMVQQAVAATFANYGIVPGMAASMPVPQNVPLQLSVAIPPQPCVAAKTQGQAMATVATPGSSKSSVAPAFLSAPISDWSEHVEAVDSQNRSPASLPLERREARAPRATYAEKATASLIPEQVEPSTYPSVIFTNPDGSLRSTESSDLRVSEIPQEEL